MAFRDGEQKMTFEEWLKQYSQKTHAFYFEENDMRECWEVAQREMLQQVKDPFRSHYKAISEDEK